MERKELRVFLKISRLQLSFYPEVGNKQESSIGSLFTFVSQAGAEAENADNTAEQLRLRGKVFRYGEVVQASLLSFSLPVSKRRPVAILQCILG